jgi:hypothetical protein
MYIRLATRGSDYAKCKRAFIASSAPLEYPTIMAEKEARGVLFGYLSTSTKTGFIVAGPIYIDHALPPLTRGRVFIAMTDAYRLILMQSGIDRCLFWVPYTETEYLKMIRKQFGAEPFEVDVDGNYWFKYIFDPERMTEYGRKHNGIGAAN